MIDRCVNCKGMHLDSYTLSHMGIVQSQTYLRIGNHNLHCVPYYISCRESKLLVALSPEEHKQFNQYSGELHKLYMTMEDPYTMEIVTIFVNAKIDIYDQMLHDSNFCFIDIIFKSAPQPLLRMIKKLCDKMIDIENKFFDFKTICPVLNASQISKVGLGSYIQIRLKSQKKVRAKIVDMTFSKMNVYLDLGGLKRDEFDVVKIEISKDGKSIFIEGNGSDFRSSTEIEGYAFLTFELKYSFVLVDSLMPIYTYLKRVGSEIPETEEKLEEI